MGTWDFLPGRLWIEQGCAKDYMELARFHYCGGRPATWAGVWAARFKGSRVESSRVVAVGVLSWPTLSLGVREEYFELSGMSERERREFVNRNIRTISRVVVHPQFRGIGVAAEVVRCMLLGCDARYVEAIAVMGRVHPFFEKGGMTRVQGSGFGVQDEGKAYFVFDREGMGRARNCSAMGRIPGRM